MKIVAAMMALAILAGCSSFISTEQLEADALRTGDWSLVEQRERSIERRKVKGSMQCPPGYIGYCQEDFGRKGCSCVDFEVVKAFLATL